LADEIFTAGTHSVDWNGCDAAGRAMPSGSYLIKLETARGVEARKVSLIR
jgi:flagellar hook assembly protein FlgD